MPLESFILSTALGLSFIPAPKQPSLTAVSSAEGTHAAEIGGNVYDVKRHLLRFIGSCPSNSRSPFVYLRQQRHELWLFRRGDHSVFFYKGGKAWRQSSVPTILYGDIIDGNLFLATKEDRDIFVTICIVRPSGTVRKLKSPSWPLLRERAYYLTSNGTVLRLLPSGRAIGVSTLAPDALARARSDFLRTSLLGVTSKGVIFADVSGNLALGLPKHPVHLTRTEISAPSHVAFEGDKLWMARLRNRRWEAGFIDTSGEHVTVIPDLSPGGYYLAASGRACFALSTIDGKNETIIVALKDGGSRMLQRTSKLIGRVTCSGSYVVAKDGSLLLALGNAGLTSVSLAGGLWR